VGAVDEQVRVPIARYVKNGIPANVAMIQVFQDIKLRIYVELFVQKRNQLFKVACFH
jgi:hypothetical protein